MKNTSEPTSFLSKSELLIRFFSITAIYIVLYLLNNRFQFFRPIFIPQTFIDQIIPFTPIGIYPYLFAYIFPALVFLRICYLRNHQLLHGFQFHFLATTILANIIFFFCPTTISNPFSLLPLNQLATMTDPITAFWLSVTYTIDKPFNCLPSLHVAAAFTSALALRRDTKCIFMTAMILSLLIVISTFMVKQHYFYDALAGLLLSFVTLVFTYPSQK